MGASMRAAGHDQAKVWFSGISEGRGSRAGRAYLPWCVCSRAWERQLELTARRARCAQGEEPRECWKINVRRAPFGLNARGERGRRGSAVTTDDNSPRR